MDAEIARLDALSMSEDPANLPVILEGLASPEREVREAARDAAREFGDTNAIPALMTAAEAADDIEEKIDFLEAAEFLSNPVMSFAEGPPRTAEQIQADEQRRLQREARRQQSRRPEVPDGRNTQ
jgi:HEAT repeat protein